MKNKISEQKENNNLILIPKIEKYIAYILNMLVKLPRVEKFSIGNEYKISMYKMLEEVLYLNKINIIQIEKIVHNPYLQTLNRIDTLLNCQRIYLRIMKENYWIDEKKFNISMEKIYEIGKIVGGLLKYYAKNNTK